MKIRKHIRSRRLEDIQQLGVDRIVRFTFGTGDKTHHLILELYDKGNLILVDEKYMVLSLLRSHLDSAKGVAIMPGHTYAIQTVRLRQRITLDALETALNAGNNNHHHNNSGEDGGAHTSSSSRITLKQALAAELAYGTVAITHCCLSAGLYPDKSLAGPASTPLSVEEKNDLLKQFKLWDKWLDALGGSSNSGGRGVGGVILTKATPPPTDKSGSTSSDKDDIIQQKQYDEYYPLLEDGSLLEQYKSKQGDKISSAFIIFPNSFDDAVKQFYTAAAEQRAVAARAQRENAATKKLEAIREDHKRRLQALEQEAKESETKAVIIECNLDMVDAAMNAVRDAVSAGMDWAELDAMIKEEKKGGNPVAALVDSLQLGKNKVTVLLPDLVEEERGSDYGSDGNNDDGGRATSMKQQQQQQSQRVKKVKVQLDLSLSAYANARAYYEIRRKQLDKQQRTIAASKDALKAAEQRAAIAVANEKARSSAQAAMSSAPARKPYWFEKFHWFISSENYLVLSGRDAQQNELLVKRYLKKGDVYVHADLHGASSTIVINHQTNTLASDDPPRTSSSQTPSSIPPLTLSQAGQACICRSAAWDAKVVTSAWWVYHDQVSKTAPSGEYLVTGSFMIRGKKNYLPPQPLVMGFGFMFRLDEESIAAHLGERAPRGAGEEEGGVGGGGEEEDGIDDADDEQQQQQQQQQQQEEEEKSTSTASTAYEAFMDASADTLGQLTSNTKKSSSSNNRRRKCSSGSGTTISSGVEDITASFSKYGLFASGEKDEEKEGEDEEESWRKGHQGGGGQNSKRHLSAKERQLMKKKGSGGGGGGGADRSEQISEKGKKQNSQQQQQRGEEKDEEELHPMGGSFGKGKLNLSSKKAQKNKKYRHQDEEERELAMMMLQSAGHKKDKRTKKEERKRRMAAKKAGRKSGYLPQQDFSKEDIARLTVQLQGDKEDEEDSEEEEGSDSSSSSSSSEGEGKEEEDSRKEVQQQPAREDNDDVKAEVAALLAEENLDLIDEEDLAKLSMIDTLTGNPRSEDTLLYAIPVCAPYSVLSAYKHRVKLVPGNLKKGKAVRQAMEMLIRNVGEDLGRERDLMRGCPEQDGINLMVGGCRLQTPGLQKMQQAKRQKGKQQKKKKNGK